MAGMYGADVEQLRALAKVFSEASDRLERDRLTVGNQIRINAWVGPAATNFRVQWDNEHSRRVSTAAHLLAESATKLRKNAQEQEEASRATGGGSGAFQAGLSGGNNGVPLEGENGLEKFMASIKDGNRSIQDLIDAIRDGELPGGVKPWDLLTSIGEVRHIPGLEKISSVMDFLDTSDKLLTGKFDGYDAADLISGVLKSNGDPVSRLLGANVKVWSEVVREAQHADFSQATMNNNAAYASANPGVVIEEFGKATLQIGSKLVGWLL